MATTPMMNRPVLKFEPGTPYEIALKYATGKQTSNGRIMFSTTENEVFFLDEFDADQIYNLELRPQEPFRIMKRGGQILVERKRVEQPVGQAPTAPAIVEPPVQQNQQSQSQPSTPLSKLMASSYIAAIDALMVARDYAESKGISFKITNGEIRAAAHCVYISSTKFGGGK